jgi:acetate---CoA ligase (ADP-forming)
MKSFFCPASVAVVGATPNKIKGGYHIYNNLATYYTGGAVYPVNPNYTEIDGKTVYKSLSDLPERPELVIVFTPAQTIAGLIEEAARLGIKRVQIQAAGFSEVGADGARRAEAVMKIVRDHDMRVWGPNCTGSVSARDLFFSPFMPLPNLDKVLIPGPVSIIAQSGMMAGGFLLQVLDGGYFGIDKVAAIGNKMDIDEIDIIRYLAGEENTRIILMYLEGMARGRQFLELARSLAGKKTLVMLKGGRSAGGKQAALSHTGTLAGSDDVVTGALAQAGVIRVNDFIELINVGKALATIPHARGGTNIALITVSGGGGIVAADLINDFGLKLANLTEKTVQRLAPIFPAWMPPKNPVDIWPTMEIRGINEALQQVVPIVLEDENVDAVMVLPFASPISERMDIEPIRRAVQETKKPVVSWLFGFIPSFEPFTRLMREAGIPVYLELSQAARVLAGLRQITS